MSTYTNVAPYDFQRSETMIQVGTDHLEQVYYYKNNFSICSDIPNLSIYDLKQ